MPADYFRDRSHVLIAGVTGARTDYGGKTSLATWWVDTHARANADVVIFANVKGDDAPEEHADAVVTAVEEIPGAIRSGATVICLSPTDYDWAAVSRRLKTGVQALPDDMEKVVVLDEAPELDEDALLWFVRVAGNGNSCKSLVLSQAPGDLSMAVRRQCILTWVGPATEDNAHVFEANQRGNHFQYIRENHDPYDWTVITGPGDDDRDPYSPVPEVYA